MHKPEDTGAHPLPNTSKDDTTSKDAPIDTLSREGARAHARRLQQYWHDRAYPAARFWAEPVDERFAKVGTYEIYRVDCNLVNGLPPRYRDE